MLARLILLLFSSLWLSTAKAAIDVYQFETEAERQRFQHLTAELRCPKCQNQNLADSNAPIAQDLRGKIQSLLSAHKTDAEIISYMTERYGDFVLYQPRLAGKTWLLWFAPGVLLLLGLAVVVILARRNKADNHNADTLAAAQLDAQQQQQLRALLNDSEKSAL